jgi:hypothetical protein
MPKKANVICDGSLTKVVFSNQKCPSYPYLVFFAKNLQKSCFGYKQVPSGTPAARNYNKGISGKV